MIYSKTNDALEWVDLRSVEQTGTLEPGKMADVVLWNGNPFSVYAKAEKVYVDGALLYDRNDPARQPVSDFMLGQEVSP